MAEIVELEFVGNLCHILEKTVMKGHRTGSLFYVYKVVSDRETAWINRFNGKPSDEEYAWAKDKRLVIAKYQEKKGGFKDYRGIRAKSEPVPVRAPEQTRVLDPPRMESKEVEHRAVLESLTTSPLLAEEVKEAVKWALNNS